MTNSRSDCQGLVFLILMLGMIGITSAEPPDHSNECVVLLHGLARTSASMEKIAENLAVAGYRTVNHNYLSGEFTLEELAEKEIPKAVEKCGRFGS